MAEHSHSLAAEGSDSGKTALPWLADQILSWLGRNSGVILLVVLWQALTMWQQSFFFPTPTQIVLSGFRLWFTSDPSTLFLSKAVFADVFPSLGRLLLGWVIAVLVGVSLGTAIGCFTRLAEAIQPALEFLRALPSPALIPIFLVLLGTDSTMRVTVIVLGSIWPILLNSIEGVRSVDRGQLDMATVFKLPPQAKLFRIIISAASPQIFAGMRVSLSIAIILMVVSELIASSSGIGHAIVEAQLMFLLPEMWANMVLLALLGILLNNLFSVLENRVLAWHHASMRVEK